MRHKGSAGGTARRSERDGAVVVQRRVERALKGCWAAHVGKSHQPVSGGGSHPRRGLLEVGDAHPSLSSPAAGGCEGRDDDVRSYSDA